MLKRPTKPVHTSTQRLRLFGFILRRKGSLRAGSRLRLIVSDARCVHPKSGPFSGSLLSIGVVTPGARSKPRFARGLRYFECADYQARSPPPSCARPDGRVARSNKRSSTQPRPQRQSSQSSAQARPRLPHYSFFDVSASFRFLRHAQLCAPRPRIYALFVIARFHRFRRDQFKIVIGIALRLGPLRLVEPFLAMIAKKVLYDPIFQ